MRGEIVRPFGFASFPTTTNIASGATNVLSTVLRDRWPNDSFFNGWYFLLSADFDGGTPANGTISQRVSTYTAATGTLVLRGANLAAEDETVNCELSRVHPVDVQRAFNRARQDAFPQIGIVRDSQTIVTGPNQVVYTVPSSIRRIRAVYIGDIGDRRAADSIPQNLLKNPGFEDWSSATDVDDWAISGLNSTENQEAQTTSPANYVVLEGNNSARIHVVASGSTFVQTLNPTTAVALENQEIHFSAWVYSTVTSGEGSITPRIEGAGMEATADGTGHGGTGWERLEASGKTDSDADNTNISIGFVMARSSNFDFYVDEAVCILGPSEPLDNSWDPVIGYSWVPSVAGASDGGKIHLDVPLPEKKRLRIVGIDQLSSVSAETDTVEVDGELIAPIYELTRGYIAEEMVSQNLGSSAEIYWERKKSQYMRSFDNMMNAGRVLRLPRNPVRSPIDVY